ncbi:MBL fold metallo-hydrolase [Rhodococcus opacus]|uniref:MBL fold metallo-hydrolase n=1 Tax=Rhodococcus opacus TaxID=37919 RepID=UPI001C4547D0|nr:MBL fold metallo-hydrolase [Rhodococcus opacus]MBV6756710.1 MBL fold metallo-hydrolase [Rhodococcus opacus]
MKIGDIEVQPVRDGTSWEPSDVMLRRPGVEDPWSCHPGARDEHGRLHFEVGGFLIRTGDRRILVDAGLGTVHKGRHLGGGMLDSLHELGETPETITDVVFTHLHFDHVGWATQKGKIVFPNATYRVHQADWAHFMESPEALPGAVKKLTPLSSQLETFDADATLAPGFDTRHAPGHTPGSTIFIISSGSSRALLLGDVVHSVVELEEPDWEGLVDLDPVNASAVRNAVADEVADTDALVAAAHFPDFQFGRVVRTEQGRKFHFI